MMDTEVAIDRFRLAETFTISRGSRDLAEVLTVTVSHAGITGRGECVPYARYGETLASVIAQIEDASQHLGKADPNGATDLADSLPPGAARNALDCAVWDWKAKQSGRRVWDLHPGLAEPKPVTTAFTLSLDAPDRMKAAAARQANRPLLKIKLGGEDDMARLEAVRSGAPQARIIVDANEGWSVELYRSLAPHLVRLGVELVEQPLPAGQDHALAEFERTLPVCADESCHDRESLGELTGRYDMVNIKLDKAGGLTEALALHQAARARGFGVFVGCMVGSSLAMAPALLVAQGADIVDLDGPLLLAEDRDAALRVEGSLLHPPKPELWG